MPGCGLDVEGGERNVTPRERVAKVLSHQQPDTLASGWGGWLMFDWANRVIGWQDPDYAVSAAFDLTSGSPMAQEALAHRPEPGPDGRMPDPRSRAGMADLYAYAHLLGDSKRRAPGADVMSILMSAVDDEPDGAGGELGEVTDPAGRARNL